MINFKDQTKRRFLENNRHCLLRHMPIEYQKLFFFGRHNLGNLFEQLEKLAFMGLITFENIQKRQKEQGFTDYGPTWLITTIITVDLYGPWSPDKEMTGAALHNFSKDVFNVYVHRNASILDTRDCSPAKMFIRSEEIGSFKREKFHFNSVEAVNHYWSGPFSKTR